MASTYTSISLTDGTITVNLQDFTNYSLQEGGWSPKVAAPRMDTIGNRCPYEDVVEELTISILSSALTNLNTLQQLVRQAGQYARGDNVAAVTLNVEPQGITAGAWKALVLSGNVELPDDWADKLMVNTIENVKVVLLRRGLWTRSEYTSTTSGATGHDQKASVTLTNPGTYGYASEIIITQNADEDNTAADYWNHPGYIIISPNTARIVQNNFSGTADTANVALGGSIQTLSAGTGASIGIGASLGSGAKRIAVFGTFKTSDTTQLCSISARDNSASGDIISDQTYFTIPATTSEDVTFCGILSWPSGAYYATILNEGASASVTIDMMWFVDVSDPAVRIIKIPNLTALMTFAQFRAYRIYNPSTALSPLVQGKVNTYNYVDIPFQGDAWVPVTNGTMYCARVARGRSTFWQPVSTGPTAITNTFQIKAMEASIILR